ncbi:hypothetical protein Vretimale_14382, partial [Volvox reticuliferus]
GTNVSSGAGGDVSGLPLEQQVVHYARAGAAAAAGDDAVKAAMAFHLLNGCFSRATGGFEGFTALAAAAASAAPGLVAALVEAVSEGAPQSLMAYNTLSYLALSAEVVPQLLSSGLVAVLVGQARAAATSPLEQQLLVSGLALLVTMTRVNAEARGRLAGMRGVAAALGGSAAPPGGGGAIAGAAAGAGGWGAGDRPCAAAISVPDESQVTSTPLPTPPAAFRLGFFRHPGVHG